MTNDQKYQLMNDRLQRLIDHLERERREEYYESYREAREHVIDIYTEGE